MSAAIMYQPLATRWPKPETKRRKAGPFQVGIDAIFRDLVAELAYLKVREAMLEFDMAPASFRKLDGRPFSDARGNSPKVLLRFVMPGIDDELQYACDTFHSWGANLRAISLTLAALRAVDRYGATTGREQYRGFKALGPGSGPAPLTPAGAARILLDHDPMFAKFAKNARGEGVPSVLASEELFEEVAMRAIKSVHPDAGGNADEAAKVNAAREVLRAHFAEAK